PASASLSSVGILHGPPNALGCPKPMSSCKTTTTLGAPFGAFTSNRGGALALRASSSVIVGGVGSGTGSTVRLICCAVNDSGSKLDAATSKCITREFFFTVYDFIVLGFVLLGTFTLPKISSTYYSCP